MAKLGDLERKFDLRLADLAPTSDKEHKKTYEEVFDRRTLMVVYKLMQQGIVRTVEHPVATGKEANLFRALNSRGGNVALKVYRQSTATFQKVAPYILGDPRFARVGRSKRALRLAWARKEFANLKRMHAGGVRVPEPLTVIDNVVAMEFIGWHDRPYPTLKELPPDDLEAFWELLVENWQATLATGLVHGDLSEYNLLVRRGEPVIIDVAQAVLAEHPMAVELHQRDCTNIARYFARHMDRELTPRAVMERVGQPKATGAETGALKDGFKGGFKDDGPNETPSEEEG